MTHIHRFSISTKHIKEVHEALDKWKHRGPIQSDKICEAIIKLHRDEEKGTKITAFNGEQSKLPLLPPVYEIPTKQDIDGLDYNDLRTLQASLAEWQSLVNKTIATVQSRR